MSCSPDLRSSLSHFGGTLPQSACCPEAPASIVNCTSRNVSSPMQACAFSNLHSCGVTLGRNARYVRQSSSLTLQPYPYTSCRTRHPRAQPFVGSVANPHSAAAMTLPSSSQSQDDPTLTENRGSSCSASHLKGTRPCLVVVTQGK